jgi:hypothetical protein
VFRKTFGLLFDKVSNAKYFMLEGYDRIVHVARMEK